MKSILAIFCLLLVCNIANAAPADETPWWDRVEEFKTLALTWLAALTAVGMALITAIALLWSKIKEVMARQDRATDQKNILLQAITNKTPLIVCIIAISLGLSGCSTMTEGQRTAMQRAQSLVLSGLAQYADTGTIDYAWVIPAAINSVIPAIGESRTNQQAAQLFIAAANEYTAGNRNLKAISQRLAALIIQMNPQTPQEREALAVAISVGTTQALQQL